MPQGNGIIRKLFGIAASIAVVVLGILTWFNRYNILDWWNLRNYNPPAVVEQLAQQDTMDTLATHIFYAQHPQIDDRQQLSSNCQTGELTIVLGCYVSGKGIFLFSVNDPRLNGVEQVTAAHEMLHAAYDRMSSTERQQVDNLTAQAFAQVTDQRIRSTVEQYRKRDSSVVPNELHSILGTEVRNLPPALEQHYQKYFTHRATIVGYSEQYQREFTSRQAQVTADDQKLTSLKSQIDANQAELDTQLGSLNTQRQQLLGMSRSDQSLYNAQVNSFNNSVNAYNSLVVATKSLIQQYNDLVNQRNALAVEVNSLNKEIDSRPTSVQGQ